MTDNEAYEVYRTQGSPEALEDLYQALHTHARAVCWEVLGIVDSEVVSRIVHATLDSLEFFQGRSKFSTWVHSLARRVCLNEIRRRRTHREESLGEHLLDKPSPEGDARKLQALQEEIDLAFQDSLDRYIYDHRLQGYELQEIAERLGVPLGTVSTRWWRFQGRLRKALGQVS